MTPEGKAIMKAGWEGVQLLVGLSMMSRWFLHLLGFLLQASFGVFFVFFPVIFFKH